MNADRWLSYFQRNRTNRTAIPWERDLRPEPPLRAPIIASLQRFQIGETGEGKHLMKGARATGDTTYVEAMRLFIEEEHEHARLLVEILARLDAPLLEGHWSDGAFIVVRHLAGLRAELMVLLAVEMIAKRYYRALRDGTQDQVLRAIFTQIIRDENGHVAFHCDTLRQSWRRWPVLSRCVLRMGWRLAYRAACLVLLLDHRGVLRACGVPAQQFWRDCGAIFDRDAAHALALPTGKPMQVAKPSRAR